MDITCNKLALRKIKEAVDQQETPGVMARVFVDHMHGNHAHYAITIDLKKPDDTVVPIDDVQIIVSEKDKSMVDGLSIKYLLYPTEGWKITNPSKNNTGDH